jgi:hypothetical protein
VRGSEGVEMLNLSLKEFYFVSGEFSVGDNLFKI